MSEPNNDRICIQCIMDTTDGDISFDEKGVCNHCHAYVEANRINPSEIAAFNRTIDEIRQLKGKYNCLVGVSGGLDSTFLLIHAVQDLKLRPLAVHVDNGWNTGLANTNIVNLCNSMGVDLYSEVLDWDEFKKMQLAVLDASTPDLEAPTDLFINYTLRRVAKQFDIKHVLAGTNPQTEAVMGSNWSYGQRDPIYLKGLYQRTWGGKPKKLPFKNWYLALLERFIGGLNIVRPLKYTRYGKNIAVERSQRESAWVEYPRKHGESFITRFYQDYFLPQRFGFDKRKAHLSGLILNGDITRDEALRILHQDELQAPEHHEADIAYLCTKLEISREQFNDYMSRPLLFHGSYRSIKTHLLFRIFKYLKSSGLLPKFISRQLEKIVLH